MKKCLVLLLVFTLIFACTACGSIQSQTIVAGDAIEIGGYDWRVLDIQDNKALVLSEKVLLTRAYHPAGGEITWADSDIRAYLNENFYQETFTEEERLCIVESAVENTSNSQYGTGAGVDTVDKIFLLSAKEAEQYLPISEERIAENIETGEVVLWWLRTPGRGKEYAADVSANGSIDYHGILVVAAGDNESVNNQSTGKASGDYASSVDGGVRPAMWIEIS